jgi:DNA-binding PadR family transcriptional regulator
MRDLSASIAVLGLLARQRDTIPCLRLRLEEEYPSAHWSNNIVHTTLPSLVRGGLVRIAREGSGRSQDLYEVTPEGAEHVRNWLSESTGIRPVLRDVLCAKLKYVEEQPDLHSILRHIRAGEEHYVREAEAARTRYRIAKELGHLDPSDERDSKTIARRAVMIYEVRKLHGEARGLQRLRENVEDPNGDHSRSRTRR